MIWLESFRLCLRWHKINLFICVSCFFYSLRSYFFVDILSNIHMYLYMYMYMYVQCRYALSPIYTCSSLLVSSESLKWSGNCMSEWKEDHRLQRPAKFVFEINTHYIHSVLVQDFVSGRACCVNQYHYKSRKRRVVMWLVHATGKNWYKVLYKHIMYVISLSNISIKSNLNK